MKGWDLEELKRMARDEEWREAHGATIAAAVPAFASFLDGQDAPRQAERGRRNRRSGQRFEDDLDAVLEALWIAGCGIVFNTDGKSKFIKDKDGNTRVIYQRRGNGRPKNPPDYMGVLWGMFVGFDAKVNRSGHTYYATREKKKIQHAGIVALAKDSPACSMIGYVIEWDLRKISFIRAGNCLDGKVRMDNSSLWGETVEDILRQWGEGNGIAWPI